MIEPTPESASAPPPVSDWPFRIAAGRALSVALVGFVLSIRICAAPVLTASVFATRSVEKYLIVYVPSAVRRIDVPVGEPVVGSTPFVV